MANPPRKPTRPGSSKQPQATSAVSPAEERAFTASEAVQIMLSPDFHHDRVERVRELLDEAKRLRIEQKEARRAKKEALSVWNANRTAETSAAFDEACDRCDALQEHVVSIIQDIDQYRDISYAVVHPHRRAAHPKPAPQG